MSQASYVGVFLYFLAGLLPDPDGPWTPTIAHANAWLIAICLEVTISTVMLNHQDHIPLPNSLISTLFTLGMARVGLLVVMIALLALWRYKLRPEKVVVSEETEGLLENGSANGAKGKKGYGATNGHAAAGPGVSKPRDAQSSGWFDYFAGFRILFPYLWPADSKMHQLVVVLCVLLLLVQRKSSSSEQRCRDRS